MDQLNIKYNKHILTIIYTFMVLQWNVSQRLISQLFAITRELNWFPGYLYLHIVHIVHR